MKIVLALVAALAATSTAHAAAPATAAVAAGNATLLPVQADRASGKIVLTLPPPGADGVAARLLHVTALRTGLGSAPIGLDRAMNGATQVLVFRRIGNKVAVQFENPRFRATDAPPAEQAAVRDSFAVTTVWLGAIAKTNADGSLDVDISSFLTRDIMNIAGALQRGGAKGAKRVDDLSVADPASLKAFPDNIEIDAVQTYQSDEPGVEIENIAPDPRQISFTVHHSFIRLPDAGYQTRRFDPRAGGFASQVVDFAAPLGQDVVYDLANRFRLEKLDPAAARSGVRKPIIFYIDRSAPEPIRGALAEGVGWWAKAFEAAGYIDAFQVRILPEGVDPLDVRYNVVNWVNRA
ncbi:MAG TPA: DUF5117 domain-containing protein, partial [Polymorphobacter sp.]|nr:DUF5117 domain-containing protein [Polymorphobacter sp.]